MKRMLAVLTALLVGGCAFQINKPEQFQTNDTVTGKDVAADGLTPDSAPPDQVGPACSSDDDCNRDADAPPVCHAHRCVEGECVLEVAVDEPCDDGSLCTTEDKCNAKGECVPGTVKACPEPTECSQWTCEPETGDCQEQVKPGCGGCYKHGDVFEGDGICCGELDRVEFCYLDGSSVCPPGEPCEPSCACDEGMQMCIACGDKVCQEPEDFCNCPEDCPWGEENQCKKNGGICFNSPDEPEMGCPPDHEPVPLGGCGPGQICCMPATKPCVDKGQTGQWAEGTECCPGLTAVDAAELTEDGGCVSAVGTFVCVKCGDTICQPEIGENHCNCPKDCPEPGNCTSDEWCPEGMACVEGQCQYCSPEICNGLDDDCDGVIDDGCQEICFAEICNDGKDNDCDDAVDEAVCVQNWCPDILPPFYVKAALHQVVQDPGPLLYQPIAVGGRAGFGFGGCEGTVTPPCKWDLVVKEQGINPKQLKLLPSDEIPNVGCFSEDMGPLPEKCEPLTDQNNYIVWGVLVKTDNSDGEIGLELHGFCKP